MNVKIRKFEAKDAAQTVELCDEIREYHRKILNGYFAPLDRGFEKNALLSTVGNGDAFAFVAVDGDKVVGLLTADKRNLPYLENSVICSVGTFGVTREYRRQGIGKMLMDKFLAFCKENGVQEVKLGVFNDNRAAYKFYEDYGFQPQEQKMSLKFKI